jgi:addiction module HigA family antidote
MMSASQITTAVEGQAGERTMTTAPSPVHPGDVLRLEFLEQLGLPADALAAALHVDPQVVAGLLSRQRPVDGEMARRLSRDFGTSPQFWLSIQARWELDVAGATVGDGVAAEVAPRAA